LNVQKGINLTQITCTVPSFCHVQDEPGQNKKNNATSRYADVYRTISCKRSTTLQQHYSGYMSLKIGTLLSLVSGLVSCTETTFSSHPNPHHFVNWSTWRLVTLRHYVLLINISCQINIIFICARQRSKIYTANV